MTQEIKVKKSKQLRFNEEHSGMKFHDNARFLNTLQKD